MPLLTGKNVDVAIEILRELDGFTCFEGVDLAQAHHHAYRQTLGLTHRHCSKLSLHFFDVLNERIQLVSRSPMALLQEVQDLMGC